MQETDVQVALALFGAGAPDGYPGPKTSRAIRRYEANILNIKTTGVITKSLTDSLRALERQFSPKESDIRCKCGKCSGYGAKRFLDKYRSGKPKIEAYHQYEYEGVSELARWAFIIIAAMYPQYKWILTSGYRCHYDNESHKRTSTNHMGKALDMQPDLATDKELIKACAAVRRRLSKIGAQVRWRHANVMSLEPSYLAPTWIHVDCRRFDRKWISNTLATH